MIDYGFGINLRRIKEDDLPKLYEWRNDPAIYKLCRQFEPLHEIGHFAWYKKQADDPSISMYIAYDAKNMLGVCGFTSIDRHNRRAEFSCYVGPEFQKNGFGRAILKTLFNHGFMAYGFNTIWGETFGDNPAAVLFEKIGLRHSGTMSEHYFRDGKFVDTKLYQAKASQWSFT